MMRGIAFVFVAGVGVLRGLFGGPLLPQNRAESVAPMIVTVADTPLVVSPIAQVAQLPVVAAPPTPPATEIIEPPETVTTAEPSATAIPQGIKDTIDKATARMPDESIPLAERVRLLELRTGIIEEQLRQSLDAIALAVCNCETKAAPRNQTQASPQLGAPVQQQKTITMFTESWCQPCQVWKATEQPLAEQDGYLVIPQSSGGGTVPRFRVKIGDSWADHTGYLSRARLKQIEQAILQKLQRGK